MSDPEDFERGYYGHGRGVVVTQPEPGKFIDTPMTAGQLAAREPALLIAGRIFEIANAAAFAYIQTWTVIGPAIDQALALQAEAHDRRVTDLLAANTAEVERRREAEAERDHWRTVAGTRPTAVGGAARFPGE